MTPKETLNHLNATVPDAVAELKAALKAPSAPPTFSLTSPKRSEEKPAVCEECLNTGICGDEGPGMRNARLEWVPCDCPAGRIHKTIPECLPEHKAEQRRLQARILVLEDALNEIYHWSSSTEQQLEVIRRVLGHAMAPDIQVGEPLKQKGTPPPKTVPEKLLSFAHWLRGRVDSEALPSTTMSMLRQRVDRLSGYDYKKGL